MKPQRLLLDALLGSPAGNAEPQGWAWDVVIIAPGVSLATGPNGLPWHYSREFLAANHTAFEAASVFVDHDRKGVVNSVHALVGVIENVRLREDGAVGGTLRIFESEDHIRQKLVAAAAAGHLKTIGLSIAVFTTYQVRTVGGQRVIDALQVLRDQPVSVDLVTFPAAGGRLLRAVAGIDPANPGPPAADPQPSSEPRSEQGAQRMRERIARMLQSLRALAGVDATRVTAIETELNREGADLEGVFDQAVQVMAAVQPAATAAATERVGALETRVTELVARVEAANTAQRAAESRLALNTALDSSQLPERLRREVVRRFEGQTPSGEQIATEITAVRAAYADVVASPGRVGAAVRIEMGLTSREKMQVALDRLFGVRETYRQVHDGAMRRWESAGEVDRTIASFRGIQQAYIAITGDHDLSFQPSVGRATEDWDAAGFANALGNTLHRRLIQDYLAVDYGLDLVCPPRTPHRVALADFRSHEVVRVGYLGDLTEVDPETDDWPEITRPTDEKASYSAVQFGGIISVTRKHIINDDIGTVMKVVPRLGRAAARTLARRLWKKWVVDNPAIYDGVAFFHATHNNLGSTALAAAEYDAIRTALGNQTEKDSGEKLGLTPAILAVPIALYGGAIGENIREFLDSNLTPNKARFMFGQNSERIIRQPLFTDANDYVAFADPDECQTFEIGFLRGQQEPELLLADNQVVGKAFSGDRIQWKIRHEYEVVVVDYRGAYKEVVA